MRCGIGRVDPEVVVVAVRDRDLLEVLAAVLRSPEIDVQHPERVGVLRVGEDVVVVPRPLREIGVVGQMLPGRAGVVGAIDAFLAELRVDDRPHAVRARRRDAMPMRPFVPLGSPGFAVSSVHVVPPSVVL